MNHPRGDLDGLGGGVLITRVERIASFPELVTLIPHIRGKKVQAKGTVNATHDCGFGS